MSYDLLCPSLNCEDIPPSQRKWPQGASEWKKRLTGGANGWEDHNELWPAFNHREFWGQYEKKRNWQNEQPHFQSNLFVDCTMLLHLSRSSFFNFFSILFLLIYKFLDHLINALTIDTCVMCLPKFFFSPICDVCYTKGCDVLHQRGVWRPQLSAVQLCRNPSPGLVWWHHPPPPLSWKLPLVPPTPNN